MRHLPRLLVFLIAALLAFWFTAENSGEIVRIDLAFVRVRASLPLVVFGSMLLGMIATLVVGWRADRRTRELLGSARARRPAPGDRSRGPAPGGPEPSAPDDAARIDERHGEPVA